MSLTLPEILHIMVQKLEHRFGTEGEIVELHKDIDGLAELAAQDVRALIDESLAKDEEPPAEVAEEPAPAVVANNPFSNA